MLFRVCMQLLAIQFLLLCGTTAAQSGTGSASEEPVAISAELDVDVIEARLVALQVVDGKEAPQQSVLTGIYQSAIESVHAAQSDRARAAEFRRILSSASEEMSAITSGMEALESQAAPEVSAQLSDEDVNAQLSVERSRLSALQSKLQEHGASIDLIRSEQTRSQLAAAEAELAEAETLTQTMASSGDQAIFEARTLSYAARKIALRSHINALDQQLITYETRLDLANARARYVMAQRDRSQVAVQLFEAESLLRKSALVDLSIERTQELAGGLASIPVEVREFLEINKSQSDALIELISLTRTLNKETASREAELRKLQSAYETLTQQLRVAGFNISSALATALRKEREEFAERLVGRKTEQRDYQQQIIDRRLAQIDLESLLKQDAQQIANDLLSSIPNGSTSQLTLLVDQLVVDRLRILSDLHGATGDQVAALASAQSAAVNHDIVFNKYGDLVDELLFWVPSTAVIHWKSLREVGTSAMEAMSPSKLANAAHNAWQGLGKQPLRFLLVGALMLLVWRLKSPLLAVLEESGKFVGMVQHDQFRNTLLGLLVTLLLCLPLTLFLLLCSWIIELSGAYQSLVPGLQSAAQLYFLLAVFYQLCRPGGIGERHFKWRARTVGIVRRNLRWLIAVLVPISVVTNSIGSRYGTVVSDALGILAFVIASIAVAMYFHYLLKPVGESSKLTQKARNVPQTLIQGSSFPLWLLYFVAVSSPLLLAILALNGYYYTAVQLLGRLFLTSCVIALGVVVFFLSVRLFAISERRLRFRRLVSERKASKERHDEQELAAQSGEAFPANLDDGLLDMVTIGAQTRSLARLVVVLLCASALWSIWSSLLPALGVFDDIVLWQTNSGLEGNYELQSITLGIVGLACLWLVVTVVATRNLPGLVDMMLLSKLDFDPGTNYAITTVLNYLIWTIGLVAVCYLLGAQWSKLQWLVAALSVGLGFGLQEIVANFVSGLLILFERPIRVGDTVTVGGNTGTVTKIRIRATTVMDWDRKEQIIPNKTFITEQLTNWTLSDPITRIIIRVGVSYDSDVDQVHQVLTQIVKNHARSLQHPPPSVFFVGFGDSSLNYELRVFVSSMLDLMPVTHELNSEVFRKLAEHGIEIPFPQRDLHIRSSDINSN